MLGEENPHPSFPGEEKAACDMSKVEQRWDAQSSCLEGHTNASDEHYQAQFYVLWHNESLWAQWRICHKLGKKFFFLFSIFHFFFGFGIKLVNKKTPLK